jgi:hypothetical protein
VFRARLNILNSTQLNSTQLNSTQLNPSLPPPQENALSPLSLYLFQNTDETENIPLQVEVTSFLAGRRICPQWTRPRKDNKGETVKSWFDGLAKLYAFTINKEKSAIRVNFSALKPIRNYKLQAFDFADLLKNPRQINFYHRFLV